MEQIIIKAKSRRPDLAQEIDALLSVVQDCHLQDNFLVKAQVAKFLEKLIKTCTPDDRENLQK